MLLAINPPNSSWSREKNSESMQKILMGRQMQCVQTTAYSLERNTLPKIERGLSFRNPKAWNKALLSKILSDIQSKKDSLWVHWVHQFYLKCKSFWAYKIKHEDSPLIKQIIALRDIASEEMEHATIQRINGEMQSKLAYDHFRPRGIKLK